MATGIVVGVHVLSRLLFCLETGIHLWENMFILVHFHSLRFTCITNKLYSYMPLREGSKTISSFSMVGAKRCGCGRNRRHNLNLRVDPKANRTKNSNPTGIFDRTAPEPNTLFFEPYKLKPSLNQKKQRTVTGSRRNGSTRHCS